MLKCLIVGKDARTDCLASALTSSGRVRLFSFLECAIPGLIKKSEDHRVGKFSQSNDSVLDYARKVKPDFAVIGPEEPLEIGLVDALAAIGVPAFGPSRNQARVEASKAFTRGVVKKYGIPGNPDHEIFWQVDGLRKYMEALGEFVVKPDGLSGGKGVRVYPEHFSSLDEAFTYAASLIGTQLPVIIEERLVGEEFSIQTITDGETYVHCPVAQDHKRADEGDTGPNTGGMGSYSCEDHGLPFLSTELIRDAQRITELFGKAIGQETGAPFKGVLYGGFMATAEGIRLLEYNARFGDPECMNVVPILETDFVSICESVIAGTLSKLNVRFSKQATVCKYIVPREYPDTHKKISLSEITIPDDLTSGRNLQLYHAAVEGRDGKIYLTRSRSLAVVGIDDTLERAEQRAEAAASRIGGNVRHRRDIGTRELVQRRVEHMKEVLHSVERF